MKLVFLSHVSDCAGGAQRCLLDLLRGLKRIWGIERSGFFNGREKWAKGFENQRV